MPSAGWTLLRLCFSSPRAKSARLRGSRWLHFQPQIQTKRMTLQACALKASLCTLPKAIFSLGTSLVPCLGRQHLGGTCRVICFAIWPVLPAVREAPSSCCMAPCQACAQAVL